MFKYLYKTNADKLPWYNFIEGIFYLIIATVKYKKVPQTKCFNFLK